jgi:hypothetical protein
MIGRVAVVVGVVLLVVVVLQRNCNVMEKENFVIKDD